MHEDILSRLSAMPGRISFYYKNQSTGEELTFSEKERMMAASVIKLFPRFHTVHSYKWRRGGFPGSRR